MSETHGRPDRTLVIILGVIAALVIVALVVVFSRGTPELLDSRTPEGVVQRYSAAVLERDFDTATEYLTASVREGCETYDPGNSDSVRMTLVSTTEKGDSAHVRVSILTTYGSGPFGGSNYEEEGVFDLEKSDGTWLIQSAPWAFTICLNAEGIK